MVDWKNTDDNMKSNCSMTRKYSSKRSEFLRFNLYFCHVYRRILLFVFATISEVNSSTWQNPDRSALPLSSSKTFVAQVR